MPVKKLKDFLDKNNIKYVSIRHSTAYTAQEIAASAHVKGRNMAKTVMVKVDGELAMAVLPAKYRVDLDRLKEGSGGGQVELATEQDFVGKFTDCEAGAMPPFGNLYDMRVYADETLKADKEIAFNAGSHSELIQLSYLDFEALVRPAITKFSVPA